MLTFKVISSLLLLHLEDVVVGFVSLQFTRESRNCHSCESILSSKDDQGSNNDKEEVVIYEFTRLLTPIKRKLLVILLVSVFI